MKMKSNLKKDKKKQGLDPELLRFIRVHRLSLLRVDDWIVVQRRSFDATVDSEPYHSVQVLLDLVRRVLLCRVWGRTVSKSIDADDAFVVDMCKRVFEGSAKPCLGRVLAKEGLQEDLHNSTLTYRVPFYRQTSPECHGYYSDSRSSMCQSCERLFGTCNIPNEIGGTSDVSSVAVKCETERFTPVAAVGSAAPEIVIKVEDSKNGDPKDEGRIGDFVAQGDDFEEEEGFSYDEDSEITYSDEEDDDDDGVKPQSVDYLEFIDPSPKAVSRRVAKKRGSRGRRAVKGASGRIPCDVCGRTFSESLPLALQVHKFKEHLINSYRCPGDCMAAEEAFSKPEELLNHLKVSHPGQQPECPKCKALFDFDDYISHLIECAKEESVKTLRRRTGLSSSKSKSSPSSTSSASSSSVVCDICGKNVNKHYLSRHMVTHTGEKNFKCDECGMMLASKQGLKGHKTVHLRERGLVESGINCDQCRKSFTTPYGLKYHIAAVHNKQPIGQVCKDCGMEFPTKTTLANHRFKVHYPDRFQCKVCSKVCTSGAALKSHMVRHEEGGFECGICGKKLKREASYMVHIRKHTGEEPFECNLCDYASKSKDVLHNHVKTKHKDEYEQRKRMNIACHGLSEKTHNRGIFTMPKEEPPHHPIVGQENQQQQQPPGQPLEMEVELQQPLVPQQQATVDLPSAVVAQQPQQLQQQPTTVIQSPDGTSVSAAVVAAGFLPLA